MITCGGSRFPAVNSIRKNRLNRQLNRVTANASIDEMNSTAMTAGIVTISEFR